MKLQELLNQIDENQIKISAFGKFDDAILKKINYKFRLDWNYYSNKMEGGTLTRDETRSVMVGNITVGGKPIKDVMEMKGHDTIVLDILKIGRGELKISEKRIKDIHKAIMHEETSEKTALIGEWKKTPNEIINYKSEKISFSIPADVPELMHQLVDKTNSTLEQFSKKGKNASHPLLIASNFHLDFVTIHPFYDGNGRTTRILTNLILITCGLPPIIIKESDKKVYYQYLADIQAYGGDRELFHSFLANKLLESQQLVLDALEGKSIDEPEDLSKEIELLKRKLSDKIHSKSPKHIYSVFKNINEVAWKSILETINQFKEFYNDNKEEHFVNHLEEKYNTYTTLYRLSSLYENSTKPDEIKIFGYNIYDTDISKIDWSRKNFGLKGATKNNKCETNLSLDFHQNYYSTNLSINNRSIYSHTFQYDQFPLTAEIQEMKKAVSKEIIKIIKEYTDQA